MKRVPGVIEARFSYEEGAGVVTFDPEVTTPDAFIRELQEKTGFIASVAAASQPDQSQEAGAGESDRGRAPDRNP